MIWKNIPCNFCGEPMQNSTDYVKDRGKNGWRLHYNCSRKLEDLRTKYGEVSKSKYYDKFHMLIVSYKHKHFRVYP